MALPEVKEELVASGFSGKGPALYGACVTILALRTVDVKTWCGFFLSIIFFKQLRPPLGEQIAIRHPIIQSPARKERTGGKGETARVTHGNRGLPSLFRVVVKSKSSFTFTARPRNGVILRFSSDRHDCVRRHAHHGVGQTLVMARSPRAAS